MANHIKTPIGELKWSSSIKPKTDSYGSTNYEVTHLTTTELAGKFNDQFEQGLKAQLDVLAKEKGQQFVDSIVIKRPYHPELDETGTPTGKWKFVAKAKHEFKGKDGKMVNNQPIRVDGDKNPLPADVEVANGSEGLIVVEPQEWYLKFNDKKLSFSFSLPMRLKVIQVTKLIQYTGKSNPLDVL